MIPPVLSRAIVPGVPTGGVPGEPVVRSYGNPGVMTRQNNPQGWKYAENDVGYNVGPNQARPNNQPETGGIGTGYGMARGAKQPGSAYGGDPPNNHVWQPGVMQTPRNGWRGGFTPSTPNDKLMTSDRHIMSKTGDPRTLSESVRGNPPNPDDPQFGAIPPVFATVNRTLNFQQGSDNNANQDAQRNYSLVPSQDQGSGRFNPGFPRQTGPQFAGEQGSGWSPVYGGVPGLYQPYGSYAGVTARDTKGIQSPVEQGTQGDGPHKVFAGPPHGLHSVTTPDYSPTIGRYMAIPQMHAVRVDRPDNSKIAGQDYSQTVQPQGQVGTVAAANTRFNTRSRFGV